MATTTFVDNSTVIVAEWLNEVDALVHDVFGGAATDAAARTNLGLGSIATQAASAVAITGGTLDGAAIGGTTPDSAVFTTLNATGGGALTGTWTDLGTVTTVDINGGTIDGAIIGGASAAALTCTTFTSTGIDDNATATAITIDASENVGIGVTPKAWDATRITLQVGAASIHTNDASNFASLGQNWYYDGTNFKYINTAEASRADQISGVFKWWTAPSGTADTNITFTERMRLDNSGKLGIGQAAPGTKLHVTETANLKTGSFQNTNASFSDGVLQTYSTRAASSVYQLFLGWSGGFADLEYNLRGDGQAYADGSWNGGGADYAEYFEWEDGNISNEDRVGTSVVLVGNKIRAAIAGETPIGVISGNPSVVGDAAWNKWNEKYLRDDFNRYIMEDYNVLQWTDEEGNEVAYDEDNVPADVTIPPEAVTVVQQRRQLNPSYDPNVEYIPREQRKEWDAVGMMGKLVIKVGQQTAPTWIKMKDITPGVTELWLVK